MKAGSILSIIGTILVLMQNNLAGALGTQEIDPKDKFTEQETTEMRQYTRFEFGQPYWVELIIGAGLALPFSWLRFYLPDACSRHVTHLSNDILELTLYLNELSM